MKAPKHIVPVYNNLPNAERNEVAEAAQLAQPAEAAVAVVAARATELRRRRRWLLTALYSGVHRALGSKTRGKRCPPCVVIYEAGDHIRKRPPQRSSLLYEPSGQGFGGWGSRSGPLLNDTSVSNKHN